MVKEYKIEYRKREILYTAGLWLISLILPDPHLPYRREFIKKRDFFYLGALLLLPLILSDPLVYLMVLAGIYAILALGLSLFLGYAGQISLGHAAFFGIGAYTTAILTTHYAFPTVGALWASALAAAVFAYLIGKPILKLKGYFLALATLGFGEIFLVIVKGPYRRGKRDLQHPLVLRGGIYLQHLSQTILSGLGGAHRVGPLCKKSRALQNGSIPLGCCSK
jgi:hypothetical protein